MASNQNQYENPLITRYASPEMSEIWSPRRKFGTWRRLWVALAEAEAELGLPISAAQIAQLKEHVDDIDFEAAAQYERRLRHDVMAHVRAYGDVCPDARGIIHLGATSCYVTDNTDLLLMREALRLVRDRVVSVIDRLGRFAREYRDSGWSRCGTNMIVNRIRWETAVNPHYAGGFKINDHFAPHLARKLMDEDPTFEGFFETRRLRKP